VLVAIDRLLARVHQVPSRAAELAELKQRLRAEREAVPDADERATALRIRALKDEIARAIAQPACCTSCADGLPAPGGTYAGGHCCSGRTPDIFVDDEVGALAQSGTRALAAPRDLHAGCAFRGPTGCSLAPADRATLCLRFVCDELRRELHRHGRLDEVEQLIAELDRQYARFSQLRRARLDREWLDAVARELYGVRTDSNRSKKPSVGERLDEKYIVLPSLDRSGSP
jgi:hypothetical protein